MCAVYDLATVRPHRATRRFYTRAEWVVYCEGYYWALVTSLRTMRLAEQHHASRGETPRRRARPTRTPAPRRRRPGPRPTPGRVAVGAVSVFAPNRAAGAGR